MGLEVDVPAQATCCGQPAWNAGHAEAAAQVARTSLRALAATAPRPVVVSAGSCATMIKVFWRELFALHGTKRDRREAAQVAERTREFSEFVSTSGAPDTVAADRTPTVCHRSCHMLRELGIREQPEALLDATGAERRASSAQDRCCGFGGLFSVKLPEVSVAMADEVLDAAEESGAARVVGCDASCLIQLRSRAERRGSALEFRHLAQVLDAASTEP
jgi:L-lactate dehydrogenase complex protein LldE